MRHLLVRLGFVAFGFLLGAVATASLLPVRVATDTSTQLCDINVDDERQLFEARAGFADVSQRLVALEAGRRRRMQALDVTRDAADSLRGRLQRVAWIFQR